MSEESKLPEIHFDINENSPNTNLTQVNDGNDEALVQVKSKPSKLSLIRMITENKKVAQDAESDYNP